MHDCVRETLCTHCIHREVCSIKMSYFDTLNKLTRINTDFSLTLSCKHYLQETPTLRTNMLNHTSISSDTLRG